MTKYLLNTVTNILFEVFVWVLLWRVGVPVNYLVGFACTTYIVKGLYKLERTVYKFAATIVKEQVLQTRILSKAFNIDDNEVFNKLNKEIQEKVYASK